MYIVSMVLGLLLIISIVGIFYYELINDHFENVYTPRFVKRGSNGTLVPLHVPAVIVIPLPASRLADAPKTHVTHHPGKAYSLSVLVLVRHALLEFVLSNMAI